MADAGGVGPTGYGSGPVIAMVGLLGGAVAVFGWGMTQLTSADGGIVGALRGDDQMTHTPIDHTVDPSSRPTPSATGDPAHSPTADPTVSPSMEPTPDPGEPGPKESTTPGTPPTVPGAETRPGPDDDTVIVTYPDTNRNGIPDPWEDTAGGPTGGTGGLPQTGRPGPDGVDAAWQTYVIKWGDTLSQISADTGVPVSRLAAINDIANPDFIYAGASLIVPPV